MAVPEGVQLSFRPSPTQGVSSYRIYRRETPDGPRTLIGETPDLSFTDTAPDPNGSYYSATALKAWQESPETDQLIWGK